MKLYNKTGGLVAIGMVAMSVATGVSHAAFWETLGSPGFAPTSGNKVYGPSSSIDIDIAGNTRGYLLAGSSWSGGTRNGWYDATDVSGAVGIQPNWVIDIDLIETTPTSTTRFSPNVGDMFEIVRAGAVHWVTSASNPNNTATWVPDPTGGAHTIALNTTHAPLASSNWYWKANQRGNSVYLDVATDLRNKVGLLAHDPIAPERSVPQRGQLPVDSGNDGHHSQILDLSLLDADAGSVDLTGPIAAAPQNTSIDVLIEIGGSNRLEAVARYIDDYVGSSGFVAYMAGDDPFESARAKYAGEWSMMLRFVDLPVDPLNASPIRFVWDFAADQEDDGDGANIQRLVVVPEPHAVAALLVFVACFAGRRFGSRGC